ncbi:MAG: hypothetical protein HGB12_12375 [Bacteroidetes bacterium]|nr:hypothetical protein [Bacteroidota bacterium]
MKQFSIEEQESKVGFFMELIKSLAFVKVKEKTAVFDLTSVQKAELDKRYKEYQENPSTYLDWDIVSKEIEKRL